MFRMRTVVVVVAAMTAGAAGAAEAVPPAFAKAMLTDERLLKFQAAMENSFDAVCALPAVEGLTAEVAKAGSGDMGADLYTVTVRCLPRHPAPGRLPTLGWLTLRAEHTRLIRDQVMNLDATAHFGK